MEQLKDTVDAMYHLTQNREKLNTLTDLERNAALGIYAHLQSKTLTIKGLDKALRCIGLAVCTVERINELESAERFANMASPYPYN